MADVSEVQQETRAGKFNAFRVLNALGHIGYTPVSAIFDIVDNAVAAKATAIDIDFELEPGLAENRRNNVLRYIIADNGSGMDREGLDGALELGSQETGEPNSLNKFGMGLKSAAMSQGNRVSVLSKKDSSSLDVTVHLPQYSRAPREFPPLIARTDVEPGRGPLRARR